MFYRHQRLFLLLTSFLVLLVGGTPVWAQETAVATGSRANTNDPIRVFLDCDECDFNHIRREIVFVHYVRDPEQADVHLFITGQGTGGNGRLYQLSFLGRGDFESITYSFDQVVERNATNDERRDALNAAIRLGLVPFVVQTDPVSDFTFAHAGANTTDNPQDLQDPWKHWVFRAYVGDIELELESNQTVFDSRWGFFADHVTEDWKVRLRPYFNYDLIKIERDGEADVRSSISRHGFESYAIRSLGAHWSAGLFGEYVTRNDQNIRHRGEVAPGIEYSLLPYEEATRRAITVVYLLGYSYTEYFEETIFHQTQEALLNQRLAASVAIRQPWGEIYAGLEGSHFFHDFSKRRAEFFGVLSVRLLEGLSLNVQGEFEMIQDQLSLPLGDASLEEILLQQRELATDFEFSGSVGLSYTFGSNFTNIVNTRF